MPIRLHTKLFEVYFYSTKIRNKWSVKLGSFTLWILVWRMGGSTVDELAQLCHEFPGQSLKPDLVIWAKLLCAENESDIFYGVCANIWPASKKCLNTWLCNAHLLPCTGITASLLISISTLILYYYFICCFSSLSLYSSILSVYLRSVIHLFSRFSYY